MTKRVSFRIVLIAALVLLLAGVALAVANRAGLYDFFADMEERSGYTVPEDFVHEVQTPDALLKETFGDLEITVTEGLGNGHDYYFNTTIALKPGVNGVLINLDSIPNFLGEAPHLSPNDEDVYYVEQHILHNNSWPNTFGWLDNDDGSISFITDASIVSMADEAQMNCVIRYVKAASGAIPKNEDIQRASFAFTINTFEATDTRRLKAAVKNENTGITLDEVYIRQTQNHTYCALFMQYEGGAAVGYKLPHHADGIAFRLLDSEGKNLATGGVDIEWIGGKRYRVTYELDIDALPDTLTIEIYDKPGDAVLGTETVALEAGPLPGEIYDAYYRDLIPMPDWRDTLPWDDWNEDMEYATITIPQGETTAIYRNPEDATTLIGAYYGGIAVRRNVTYRDLSAIYFGEYGERHVYGYIKTSDITLGQTPPADAKSVKVAEVQALALEYIDVRLEPTEDTVLSARLDNGTRVQILGAIGDWYHIAYTTDAGTWQLGYVQQDEIAETGKYTSINLR